MKLSIRNFFWLIPFICFLIGYYLISLYFPLKTFKNPNLVGMHIDQAVMMLSEYNLNIRIVGNKIDNDLPTGTIIKQTPNAQETIKAQQTIFCIISSNAHEEGAPSLISLPINTAIQQLNEKKISHKTYPLLHSSCTGLCIAQSPIAGDPLKERRMIVYVSQIGNQLVLMPSLKNKLASDVINFLAQYKINPTLTHTISVDQHHHCRDCTIVDQRPLAGSIIDLTKPLQIQLRVQ